MRGADAINWTPIHLPVALLPNFHNGNDIMPYRRPLDYTPMVRNPVFWRQASIGTVSVSFYF